MNCDTLFKIFEYCEFDESILVHDILLKSLYVNEIKKNKFKFNKNSFHTNLSKTFVCDEYEIKVQALKIKTAANKIYSKIIKKKIIDFDNLTNPNNTIIISIYNESNKNKKYLYVCERKKLEKNIVLNGKNYTHQNIIERYFNK